MKRWWPFFHDVGFYSMFYGPKSSEYAGFEFSKTIEIYRRVSLGMVQPFDSQ